MAKKDLKQDAKVKIEKKSFNEEIGLQNEPFGNRNYKPYSELPSKERSETIAKESTLYRNFGEGYTPSSHARNFYDLGVWRNMPYEERQQFKEYYSNEVKKEDEIEHILDGCQQFIIRYQQAPEVAFAILASLGILFTVMDYFENNYGDAVRKDIHGHSEFIRLIAVKSDITKITDIEASKRTEKNNADDAMIGIESVNTSRSPRELKKLNAVLALNARKELELLIEREPEFSLTLKNLDIYLPSPLKIDEQHPMEREDMQESNAFGGVHGKRNPRGTKTTPKQFRLFPNVAEALEKAASQEKVSTSRYLNNLLENHPAIAKHIKFDK